MKDLIFLFLILATGSAEASCLVHLKKNESGVAISIWKHTENVDDTVEHFHVKDLGLATDLFHVERGSIDIVFKNGNCVSMRYYDDKTSRVVKWDEMPMLHKSCIDEIAKRFNINERTKGTSPASI